MSADLPVSLFVMAAAAAGSAAVGEASDEFRVTMLLLFGTAVGIAVCLTSAKKDEENKITRALIGLIGGPAVAFMLNMASPWKLQALPYILVAFFGMVCAVGMYFVGYAGLRRTRKSEDVALNAIEDMARRKAGMPPAERDAQNCRHGNPLSAERCPGCDAEEIGRF